MLMVFAIASALLVLPAATSGDADCAATSLTGGGCGYSNSGTSLTVSGSKTTPGTTPDSPRSNTNAPDSGPSTPPGESDFSQCLSDWNSMIGCFPRTQPADPAAPPPPAPPPITMNELAVFAPDPVVTVGEPGNVGISGMPTNFVATASVHTRTGAIFGIPLTVRFTPSGFDFGYGDGSSASTTTGGQTWAALGQAQFTPTPTSHVYDARGTYPADVDVRYTAEIDIGLGWFPIAGELTTDGPSRDIRIFEAHTALVAYTCAQKPSSPGC